MLSSLASYQQKMFLLVRSFPRETTINVFFVSTNCLHCFSSIILCMLERLTDTHEGWQGVILIVKVCIYRYECFHYQWVDSDIVQWPRQSTKDIEFFNVRSPVTALLFCFVPIVSDASNLLCLPLQDIDPPPTIPAARLHSVYMAGISESIDIFVVRQHSV